MFEAEYVIPCVRMRAGEESIRRAAKKYPILEPFAPRHVITYFNNNKEDSRKSAYERLHKHDFDPRKPRCDRTKPSLFWLEISEENKGHKVPMTTNLWYGRPNRLQVDVPEKKFNRSSRMAEFYSRKLLLIDEDERKVVVC
ncbi:uncharacterized protein LOC105663070 [Megachile rotundata]|uniref:uncharacterized protein LOC105663070 n=1 Tax=Megachile rotundata TaxID=143995 RepID=UPI00061513CE|nr:PREDICTED: uncharacterized protein LOC105663070 [Megachile rotundata]